LFQALDLDENCAEALIALCDMYCASKQYEDAITLILTHISKHNTDVIHTKLASIYALNNDLENALIHYHMALKFTPGYADAIAGIERLESDRISKNKKKKKKN
jgi:anaphase-promoting complex subunit 7